MVHIKENISLKPFNTFGIEASARYFVTISSEADLSALIQTPIFNREPRLIIGGGSNVLFTTDFSGLVIKNEMKGMTIVEETDDQVELQVQSGESWHSLVLHCVQQQWGGIENLALIPGTVGAAPIQNIGAYGVEIKDCIKSVAAIDLQNGNRVSFNRDECRFSYRESIFKHELKEKYFISSVTLTLTKKKHQLQTTYGAIQDVIQREHHGVVSIETICASVIAIRKSKLPDPAMIGNAGSFFKNPTITKNEFENLKNQYPEIPGYISVNQEVKVPAGWLIEQCGWKGKRENKIGVHPQQALVLVNYGNGNGNEIFELAMRIKLSVKEKFDINISPEVNII